MRKYIETFFECTDSAQVLDVLEVFLREFAESGLASQIPADLYPVRVCSTVELRAWSTLVRIAVQRRASSSNSSHDGLYCLGTVLDAANRRIELLASVVSAAPPAASGGLGQPDLIAR